jgi:phage repressor protein C with HTH and peptisase S24 domain
VAGTEWRARYETEYVVKYVEAVRGQGLRLLSLNPLYPPATPATDRAAIVGTVIARFAREVE